VQVHGGSADRGELNSRFQATTAPVARPTEAGSRPAGSHRVSRMRSQEEATLRVAAGIALAAAMVAAGGGTGSPVIGVAGSALVAAGSLVSWRIRQWRLYSAVPLGGLLGVLAAVGLGALIRQEVRSESSALYWALGDPGLMLTLRMTILPVVLSFMLIRAEVAAFSLVPALAIFGLSGGRGLGNVVAACFLVFLPAALVVVSYAMLLSAETFGGLGRWRRRHSLILSGLIGIVVASGFALFLLLSPLARYMAQYRWRVIVAAIPGIPTMGISGGGGRGDTRSYLVGRGPIRLSETPVLSFTGEPAQFWRGQVFDLYIGTGWLPSQRPGVSVAPEGDALDLSAEGVLKGPPGASTVAHEVRAEATQPFVIYGPGQIQQLVVDLPGSAHLGDIPGLRVDAHGCVTAVRSVLAEGASYRVVTTPLQLSALPARQLQAEGYSAGPPPSTLPSEYLSVPIGARRVADLAREVAADEPSPERKILALMAYLQQHCVYTTRAPRVPRGRDAVDYFLFHQRRGYCDLFASALALMARGIGIPTRLATGYVYSRPSVSGEPGYEPGRSVIRQSDGHAWVEAYLLPWGWVTFDPTPSASGGAAMPALRRSWLAFRFFWEDHAFLGSGVGATGLALLVLGLLRLRRARRRSRSERSDADLSASRRLVVRAYADLCRLFRRRGHPRLPSQTAIEYLVDLDSVEEIAPAIVPVRLLTDLFLLARYAPEPVSEATARAAQGAFAEARGLLRKHRR
jgi:hypothetical protein